MQLLQFLKQSYFFKVNKIPSSSWQTGKLFKAETAIIANQLE